MSYLLVCSAHLQIEKSMYIFVSSVFSNKMNQTKPLSSKRKVTPERNWGKQQNSIEKYLEYSVLIFLLGFT